MKNHHEVGHFKTRLMILLLSLVAVTVMAGESFAATTCSSCHGMPPLDSADGMRQPATGAFKGNHQTHLGATATAAECSKCHANSGYDNKHAATAGYKIKTAANINSSPSTGTYSKGVFFNQTSVPVMGSCSNVNCHFERNTTDRTPAPVWGTSPALTDCNTCHDTPRGASGSHAKHEAAYGGTASCVQCHPNYGTTNFSHATSAGKDKIKVNAANGYTGGTAISWLPSQTKAYGTCSTASCHDNGRGVKVETPAWGATAPACSACHEAAPTTFSHTKHLTGLAAKFNRNAVCADCHKDYVQGTTTTADHIDGTVDVYSATSGDLGYPSDKVPGSALASCSTANCHSNGKSTFASAAWGGTSTGCNFCHPNLSAGHSVHVSTLLTEISFYNYTTTSSASGTYKFGCANCHPLSVTNHLNGAVEVELAASASGGHLKAKNGAGAAINGSLECNNVYCHSNGYKPGASFTYATTPAWGSSIAGDRCAACHGNSPNNGIVGSAAHSAHVVGIHVDDIFNGVSKKLPIGGAATVNAAHGRNNRSTTINCNICHAATVSTFANDLNPACSGCHNGSTAPLKNTGSLISNTANHVNGMVDVTFVNQKIATKAQLANSAFAGYTAANAGGWSRNSNSMNFKTYTSSYDVSKSTLAASASWSQAAGCANVACHNGKTVKWTDTVDCTSCHTRLK